jgi:hypothetical protein
MHMAVQCNGLDALMPLYYKKVKLHAHCSTLKWRRAEFSTTPVLNNKAKFNAL